MTGLDGNTLRLQLVGLRKYVRAVDILTGMQDLAKTTGVDIRFLRPIDCNLKISLAKQDKPAALARVHINSVNTPVYLLGDDRGPLSVIDEAAQPACKVARSGDGTIFDFSFAEVPDCGVLLQTVFAQYQQISGKKFTVRRLAARAIETGGNSTVRLTIEIPKNASRGYLGHITRDDVTLFNIWFQPRISGN
ncbi:MAG: hypothetical protein ABJM26_19570 [Anderseniella sp.]